MRFRRRPRTPADFKAEIASHLAHEADQLRQEGVPAPDAAAARAFGNTAMAERGNVRVAWGRSENAGRGAGLPIRSRPVAGEQCPAPEPDRPSSGVGDEGEPTNGRRGGAAPESLRRAAEERFYETARWFERFLLDAWRDLGHAARRLRRAPAFALAALLTLGFGIGANSAVFTVADALVLGGLPYPHPERLMAIGSQPRQHAAAAEAWISAPAYFDLRQRTRDFAALAALSPIWDVVAAPLAPGADADRLQALYVSANLLPLLGVQPILGRGFTAAEAGGAPGAGATAAAKVAVISNAYGQRRFGASSAALGQTLALDGVSYTVIGVLPRGFQYLGPPVEGTASQVDLWLPLGNNPLITRPRGLHFLKVVGARKPGVSAAQARAEIQALGASFAREYPAAEAGWAYDAVSLADQIEGPQRSAMLLLLAAVGLVLLLACANVSNLLLAQGMRRQPEMAVRRVLGAGRWRLLRQLMAENLLLAALGAALGLGLAWAGLRWLVAAAPASMFNGRAIALDSRAVGFTLAVLVASALLFGLAPAWTTLRGSPIRRAGAAALGRWRAAMVVTQMALALALLVGAGLLIQTLIRVLAVPPGFDVERVVTVSTQLPADVGSEVKQVVALDRRLLDRLGAVPGVESVGAVSRLPLTGQSLTSTLWPEGKVYSAADQPEIEYRVASSGYFAAMGVPVLAGRVYGLQDDPPRTVVINQAAAQRFWRGESAVGRRLKLGPAPAAQDWATIVGVVGDVRSQGLDATPPPTVFRPLAYSALGAPIVVVRLAAGVAPGVALDGIAAAIRQRDPRMPVYNRFSMDQLLRRSVAQRRFLMLLLGIFAAAGIVLAAIGVYASVAQNVARRRRELGVRLALGATPANLLRMVAAQGIRWTGIGIVAGAILAAGLAHLMRGLLFQVAPWDPAIFAAAALGLGVIGVAAALVPAWRAARIAPQAALRED